MTGQDMIELIEEMGWEDLEIYILKARTQCHVELQQHHMEQEAWAHNDKPYVEINTL